MLQFVHQLEEHVGQYLIKLEQMLGPHDSRFVFGTVRKTTDKNGSPHTHFPNGYHFNGNCTVDVHISKWPWEHLSPDQSVWQIAHESVHLLDPGPLQGTNFLEEGLATWFQNEHKFHNEEVRRYIAKNKDHFREHFRSHAEAKELVLACKPSSHLCPAVKDIRASGVRIRDIEEEVIRSRLPHVNDSIIERLCAPFYGA